MTAEPRRIEADMGAAEALHRRTDLGWMLEDGARVRVRNPFGGSWTGRIVGLSDHPAMLLERDDGRRVMLPQCFAVEEIPGERPEGTAAGQCTPREHLAWLMWCYGQGYRDPADRAVLTNWMADAPSTPDDARTRQALLGMADEILALLTGEGSHD